MLRKPHVVLKRHGHEPGQFSLGSVLSALPNASGPKAAEETLIVDDITNRGVPGEEPDREAGDDRQPGQGSRARLGVALLELAQGCRRHPARHSISQATLCYPEVFPC